MGPICVLATNVYQASTPLRCPPYLSEMRSSGEDAYLVGSSLRVSLKMVLAVNLLGPDPAASSGLPVTFSAVCSFSGRISNKVNDSAIKSKGIEVDSCL